MNQQESIDFVKKYVEDFLSFFELNLQIDVSAHDDFLEVVIPKNEISSILIGRNAENLRSLQLLLANILHNNNAVISRVNLDIAEYKKQRAEKIVRDAQSWFFDVRKSGIDKTVHLNAADRRIVHNEAQNHEDIQTSSEGEGLDRVLIITKKS